jgi:hypothetical protein
MTSLPPLRWASSPLSIDQDQTLSQIESALTVRLIATLSELKTTTPDARVSEALKIANEYEFDYLPVRRTPADSIIGIFSRLSPHTDDTLRVSEVFEPLGPGDLISAETCDRLGLRADDGGGPAGKFTGATTGRAIWRPGDGRGGGHNLGCGMRGPVGHRARYQLLGAMRAIGRDGLRHSSLGAAADVGTPWQRGEVTLGRRRWRAQFCPANRQRAGGRTVRLADRANEQFHIRRS